MTKRTVIILTALLFIFASRASAEFRAGVAVRVVTPDPLLPVSGGGGPSNPVKEKRGDLTVRALALENNGVRVAIVGADFLGFPSTLGNKVRAQVKGIPPQNILIGVTHTHSAPDCYGFPDGKGGLALRPEVSGHGVRENGGSHQRSHCETATRQREDCGQLRIENELTNKWRLRAGSFVDSFPIC